ncbi:hypothetical protein PCANC_23751 [Puccinia coronata f. sp. avenae]|uniref:Uncharacterized protein n=1 Tax=Puccinia coronata f. sp. avenae TaxID=200324 RepID=A0A2N5TN50_9BASI|nr:hypothetical protein PCASD_23853 [Puccinia coronata f. sp. avenae]PLW34882.1 hypothetical protein PCANC_23751 [Puccinia coronata f. sp. avenae]
MLGNRCTHSLLLYPHPLTSFHLSGHPHNSNSVFHLSAIASQPLPASRIRAGLLYLEHSAAHQQPVSLTPTPLSQFRPSRPPLSPLPRSRPTSFLARKSQMTDLLDFSPHFPDLAHPTTRILIPPLIFLPHPNNRRSFHHSHLPDDLPFPSSSSVILIPKNYTPLHRSFKRLDHPAAHLPPPSSNDQLAKALFSFLGKITANTHFPPTNSTPRTFFRLIPQLCHYLYASQLTLPPSRPLLFNHLASVIFQPECN